MGQSHLQWLPPDEYVWLSRLQPNLTMEADIEVLATAYKGHEKDPMYASVMNIIMKANLELYEEAKDMCTALRELFADELKENLETGIALGKAESVVELLEDVGKIPDALKEYIYSQSKHDILNSWVKLAAKTGSISDFTKQIGFLQ